mmetsp:Transcript_10488/g.16413  ORF Transcript_10488/g.16413 Transcript_10488/m.16413 type:complete len:140 (+) Transcript_10488:26-445(+)
MVGPNLSLSVSSSLALDAEKHRNPGGNKENVQGSKLWGEQSNSSRFGSWLDCSGAPDKQIQNVCFFTITLAFAEQAEWAELVEKEHHKGHAQSPAPCGCTWRTSLLLQIPSPASGGKDFRSCCCIESNNSGCTLEDVED